MTRRTAIDTHDQTHDQYAGGVTIRRLGADDHRALRRLAQLDSTRPPGGPLLGAEVDGRLLAAISTKSGDLIADPFQRTSEIVEVLRVRAAQLGAGRGRARRALRSLLRDRGVRRRASFAPSPPGAERRLSTLAQDSGR